MSDKLSCNAVQDMLPLYTEDLLSPESRIEVEAHLDECEKCRAIYAQMASPESVPDPQEEEVDYLKKIRRGKRRLLLGAVLALAVLAIGLVSYFRWQAKNAAVTYDPTTKTIVVRDTADYASLTLPDKVKEATNLEVQDESFHLSVYLPVLRTSDEEILESIPQYIDNTDKSLKFLCDYIRENASDEYVAGQAEKYVELTIRNNEQYHYTNDPDRISIELGNYYWHREEFYLFALMDSKTIQWPQLGYAWYLGACVDPYNEMIDVTSELAEKSKYYEPYVKVKGDNQITRPEDWLTACDAIAYVCLTRGMHWGTPYESKPLYQTAFFIGRVDTPGNQMSVLMAASFVGYLSEHYGFDKVTAFCFGRTSFDEAFGTDYDSAYADWSEWILQTYGE